MFYYGKSHIGLLRRTNEDTFLLGADSGFCMVADGMGGAAAGEVASRLFAESALEVFMHNENPSKEKALEKVKKTYQLANAKILNHVVQNPLHQGMGCTAELLTFFDEGFVLGHLGDSRTYRVREELLKQLTKDHSLVQDQIDRGMLTPEQARNHSLKNVILRAVGIEENLALDFIEGKIYPGDLFLLCSDGLTDMIDDDLIRRILISVDNLSQKAEKLIELANSAGGKDNITVVLAEVQ